MWPHDAPPGREHGIWRFARTFWAVALLVILIRGVVTPHRNSVYPIFANAGLNWRDGANLYGYDAVTNRGLDQFRYAPLVAATFAPLSWLPNSVGGTLWRTINGAVFLVGVIVYLRVIVRPRMPAFEPPRSACWGVFALAIFPLALTSLNNAQANPLVLGLMLLAGVAVIRERWTLAAAALAVAVLFKLYPLAVAALLCLFAPWRLGSRLVACLGVGVALPFVLQDPGYVLEQYRQWASAVLGDDRRHHALDMGYRDAELLLRTLGVELPSLVVTALRMTAGGAVALLVLRSCWRGDTREQSLADALDFGCLWMVLFGPATENATYILLVPVCGVAAARAWHAGQSAWIRGLAIAMLLLFIGNAVVTALPGGRAWAYWMCPLGGLLLLVGRLHAWGHRDAVLSWGARSCPASTVVGPASLGT